MTTQWTVRDVFADDGLISQRLPDYEVRESQVQLAVGIEQSMREGRHTCAEGPTGSGKSFAYLVPALWHLKNQYQVADDEDPDNNRVVVATANIALQEQLVQKDLPFLAEVLPDEFRYTLVKGRNNFL